MGAVGNGMQSQIYDGSWAEYGLEPEPKFSKHFYDINYAIKRKEEKKENDEEDDAKSASNKLISDAKKTASKWFGIGAKATKS